MKTFNKTERLLFTVNELFATDGYLDDKQKEFFNIPHYQRGYKWEPDHVEKLLNDIKNFEATDGKFYCLQNITIIAEGNHFNVIDGQQRLTTLIIILSYLQQHQMVANKLRFPLNSIRKMTNEFLKTFITDPTANFPNSDWDTFAKEFPQYDLQDVAHIFHVYRATAQWFQHLQKEEISLSLEHFTSKLLKDVRVIVNEVDGHTSEEKVFGNLNSKRVPLDGSDLIRAILITRVAREEGRKESDLKNIVYVNERRVKLGWELDQINNWWSGDEIKGYFAKFVTIKSEMVGADRKLFNEESHAINYLYLLYAESQDNKKLTLDLIEQRSSSAVALYKDILKLHSTLLDWYQDKNIYHFLGFIFNIKVKDKKANFKDIWDLWQQSGSRKNFIQALKEMIRIRFLTKNEMPDYCNLQTNWYADRSEELIATLILMDIIHAIKRNQPNLPFKFFTKDTHDVEHIFPQNPKQVDNKKQYIEFLNEHVFKPDARIDLVKYEKFKNDEEYINGINMVIESTIADIPINAIGNLVLLYNKLNKSISNSIYASKRSRIIEYHSSGKFIQPHTLKVFTRDFNDEHQNNRDLKYWTNVDIERSCAYINREVSKFFTNSGKL